MIYRDSKVGRTKQQRAVLLPSCPFLEKAASHRLAAMYPAARFLLRLLASIMALAPQVISAPDTFCKSFGQGSNNDFCVSISTWLDVEIDNQDFLFAFNRTQRSALGWTTFGIGDQMNRAIMFSMYGDPDSQNKPTLSVRSAIGHSPPVILSIADQYQHHIYVGEIETSWKKSSVDGSIYASASLVCFGCNSWFDAPVSAATPVLPMIWAINTEQDLSGSGFAMDAPLLMHDRFGAFDLDMMKETSIAPKRLPDTLYDFLKPVPPPAEIIPDGNRHAAGDKEQHTPGTSVQQGGDSIYSSGSRDDLVTIKRKLWLVHGISMVAAFFVLLPLGSFLIRSGSPHSLYFHLIAQGLGTAVALASMSLGFFMSYSISTWHQYTGIALGFALLAQFGMGWQHHRIFLRLKRKTWWAHMHTWHGRFVLLGGWLNLPLGLRLADYTTTLQLVLLIVAGLEICVLAFSAYMHSIGKPLGKSIRVPCVGRKKVRWAKDRREGIGSPHLEEYFALTGDDGADEACGDQIEHGDKVSSKDGEICETEPSKA